ncbi:MAG: HAMP domain-containing sensor histidine kinase [Lutibacter sp.]|uniref:sensor histidine kinase n=1 Tax=Lutibacter sp. TaxID=1925666 RepID=UPI00299E8438|nr:HAMP domain-containing sensor histidine kinase [Lutibacter sp.]MDX1829776.1 HAMP domain-containing sensor histidine kinase [Lutibacter sp.]
MSPIDKESEEYIQNLEEKIVELSLKLKQKNNQLISASKENKKVLGKLTHNLKNPIGVISSFSEMMLEDLEDYTPEKLTKYLGAIKNSAKFSINFLTSISKYTQVKSSEFVLNLEKVNLIELMDNIVTKLAEKADNKNITILKKYNKKELFLNIDTSEMGVALYNVLDNAIRYSFENTTITIAINENNDKIEIACLDEGIGISEDNLPHIFEPFFVVNTYDNEKNKCIGLGLTIAKMIVEKHSGVLRVKSKLNQGSEFRIFYKKA